MQFKIDVSAENLDLIGQALGALPFTRVEGLMADLRRQAAEQTQAVRDRLTAEAAEIVEAAKQKAYEPPSVAPVMQAVIEDEPALPGALAV